MSTKKRATPAVSVPASTPSVAPLSPENRRLLAKDVTRIVDILIASTPREQWGSRLEAVIAKLKTEEDNRPETAQACYDAITLQTEKIWTLASVLSDADAPEANVLASIVMDLVEGVNTKANDLLVKACNAGGVRDENDRHPRSRRRPQFTVVRPDPRQPTGDFRQHR